MEKTVNIIGAGISGLSAAITLAQKNIHVNLISSMPSERAQSVLAEGGINAALDTMGEHDTVLEHFQDTVKGGVFIENEEAVMGLVKTAPSIVRELQALGVPFQHENGKFIQRNFGGQKKKRTAYAKSSTGKMIMAALTDRVRMVEAAGLVKRYTHHVLSSFVIRDSELKAVRVTDTHLLKTLEFTGPCILCTGGLNGFFEGYTTGTIQNSGTAAALAFSEGVEFANLEFIQYHPTTVKICDKVMLISEAARGEGARLMVMRDSKPWYFMEEKYELGNLSPRDVISREIALLEKTEGLKDFYLDATGIDENVWKTRLSDLRAELISYTGLDPAEKVIPIRPGIHYFMGGIRVDNGHRTNIKHLFAAGEAACKYHGANRLGGNSMLGAFYGGRVAAESAASSACLVSVSEVSYEETENEKQKDELCQVLLEGLGIIRDEKEIDGALNRTWDMASDFYSTDAKRALLGCAMLECAKERKESRGAHYRSDYPKTLDSYRKQTCVVFRGGKIMVRFEELSKAGSL
ncbi:MAG: FAD-binding protein [Sphaerochaetaceae bacterium]|nr:FAD-binding protein [Sphaerochaetaceae bacterium]